MVVDTPKFQEYSGEEIAPTEVEANNASREPDLIVDSDYTQQIEMDERGSAEPLYEASDHIEDKLPKKDNEDGPVMNPVTELDPVAEQDGIVDGHTYDLITETEPTDDLVEIKDKDDISGNSEDLAKPALCPHANDHEPDEIKDIDEDTTKVQPDKLTDENPDRVCGTVKELVVSDRVCPIDPEPHNAQREPSDWQPLIEHASEILDGDNSTEAQTEAIKSIWKDVSGLDTETSERLRYFGLGHIAAKYIGTFSSPEAQTRFVESVADSYTRSHLEIYFDHGANGLYVPEINNGFFGAAPHDAEAVAAYRSLPLEERLVTSTLSRANPVDKTRDIGVRDISDILEDKSTFRSVVRASLDSATGMTQRTLYKRYEEKIGRELTSEERAMLLISEVADEDEITNIDFSRVAYIAASVRLDRMRNLDSIVRLDQGMNLDVKRADFPPMVRPIYPGSRHEIKVYHEDEFGCPALYISNAIQFVASAMPKIVNSAQRQLIEGAPRHKRYGY